MQGKTILKDPALKNILITGSPGIAKTTLIKKLQHELTNLRPVGFYTEEIRENSARRGFELISLSGFEMSPASRDFLLSEILQELPGP